VGDALPGSTLAAALLRCLQLPPSRVFCQPWHVRIINSCFAQPRFATSHSEELDQNREGDASAAEAHPGTGLS
jgi:hypothetical protein